MHLKSYLASKVTQMTATFNSLSCVLIFMLCMNLSGKAQDKPPRVQVFDNFIGQGYKTATDAAILNSKKGVLIVLLSSQHDGGKLDEDAKNIAQEISNTGRERMVIILADQAADTIHNHVRLFANGKGHYMAFEREDYGAGSGVQLRNAMRYVYDMEIKPLESSDAKAEEGLNQD